MLKNVFTKTETEFIKKLAEQEFRTATYYDTFRTQLKVHNICKKMNVCTIEEVIRKVMFYNLFDVNVSEDYRREINDTAREYISITQIFRNQMLEYGKNVSQVFGELCTHSACINEDELKETAYNYINKTYDDIETQRLYRNVANFRDLISKKYNFGMMFDTIFRIDDDCMEEVNAIDKFLHSSVAKYLMIVRMCIEEQFPIKLKRPITAEENDLLLFLSYKGDEIDYMEQYNIYADDFEKMIEELYQAYNVVDTNELLIAFNIEQSFSDSSLIYDSFFLNFRANAILQNKENYLSKLADDKKEQAEILFTELEKYTLTDFLTPATMQKLNAIFEEYRDCDFTTYGKIDKLKELYYSNVQSLEDIKQLKQIVADIKIYDNL